MKMTVERARGLLGRAADRLSDEEISRRCRELDDYARLLIRIDSRQQEERRQVGQREQGVA